MVSPVVPPRTHLLPARPLRLDDRWDVIVAGGGPAGCTAAAAAARAGARTLLLEATGCLGGMGTSALVPAWTPFSDQLKMVYRGLAAEVFAASKAGVAHVRSDDLDWVPIDPERLKRVYDDLVLSAGAEVRFHSTLAAVETDGTGAVQTLIVAGKSGLEALRARVYIDASGDADLAAWAGARFQKGDPVRGRLMPATLCFALANVDEPAYRDGPRLYAGDPASPIFAIVRSGRYPLIPDTHLCNNLVGPGTVGFNAGHVWDVDSTDPASVSRALVHGRRMAAAYRDALAEFHPAAFGRAHLVSTGALLGVRESRRIVGDYTLTVDDYLARRSFPDEICRNSYFIDIHWAQNEIARDHAAYYDRSLKITRYGPGESHGIPYRSLVPADLHNVLVAGRSVSCEQVVQGSVRVMPCCLAMGEAAGLAAATAAATTAGDVRAIDVAQLRERLRAGGAFLQ
jgi:hypothetical protein